MGDRSHLDHPRPFIEVLYRELLEGAIRYFLPSAKLEVIGTAGPLGPFLRYGEDASAPVEIDWLGRVYLLSRPGHALSDHERRMLKGITRVLSARYQILSEPELAARSSSLFRGLPEDHFVSAFLTLPGHGLTAGVFSVVDRVGDAIEVLRVTSLSTYENRRIATGALLFGDLPDACHDPPPLPADALPYSSALTSIKSFHRIADGLQTVALVNSEGLLVQLVDVREWAKPYLSSELPAPSATRYVSHARATLCGGHVCLVLTPNGEIKIFAEGAQVFNFLDGRWRLTDAVERYRAWEDAIGSRELAERLFTVAVNMAERRRGALFVVLDDPEAATRLLNPMDLLNHPVAPGADVSRSKHHLHYLLTNQRVVELSPSLIETVARIDGAILLDRDAHLLSFGAIIRHAGVADEPSEGGRTTAGIVASHYGSVLKVSEDGMLSFYRDGRRVWEM